MKPRRDVAGGIALAVSVLASVVAYPSLPERMAVHWNASGVADSMASKPVALATLPALIAVVWAVYAFDHRIDPLGSNVRAFGRYHDAFAGAILLFLAYVHVVVIAWNLGYEFGMARALAPPMAALYYAVGAVVENAERNWVLGIRTPWTLSSEAVWERTHERFGPLYKLTAPVALLGAVVPGQFVLLVLVAPILVVSLAAVGYSFLAYRRIEGGEGDQDRGLGA